MGEDADYYLDQMLFWDDMRLHVAEERKRPANTWITIDGVEMFHKDMEDTHLFNCIHLCERREGHRGMKFLNNAPTYRNMVEELIKRKKLDKSYYKVMIKDRCAVQLKGSIDFTNLIKDVSK